MTVCANDFLEAGLNYISSQTEIDKRNGISRIYYGVYHLVTDFFPRDPNFTLSPPKGIHKTYIEYLSSHPAGSTERTLGIKLSKLYMRRFYADYKLSSVLAKSDPALQANEAKAVFKIIEDLSMEDTA